MGATMYPVCSFQNPNVLFRYTLSDPLRMAAIGTVFILNLDRKFLPLIGKK